MTRKNFKICSGRISSFILLFFILLSFLLPEVKKETIKKENIFSGIVESTKKSGNYIYVKIKGDKGNFWAAVYASTVKPGDRVEIRDPLLMKDFFSKSMNMKFDVILFTSAIYPVGTRPVGLKQGGNKTPVLHGKSMKSGAKSRIIIKKGTVKKAQNGYMISELFMRKKELYGKIVKVRGIVVKVSRKILGKNWVHISDGTGEAGTKDLTITTLSELNTGDVVIVEGKIEFNKGIGSGYSFPALIRDAKINIEKRADAGNKEG